MSPPASVTATVGVAGVMVKFAMRRGGGVVGTAGEGGQDRVGPGTGRGPGQRRHSRELPHAGVGPGVIGQRRRHALQGGAGRPASTPDTVAVAAKAEPSYVPPASVTADRRRRESHRQLGGLARGGEDPFAAERVVDRIGRAGGPQAARPVKVAENAPPDWIVADWVVPSTVTATVAPAGTCPPAAMLPEKITLAVP